LGHLVVSSYTGSRGAEKVQFFVFAVGAISVQKKFTK